MAGLENSRAGVGKPPGEFLGAEGTAAQNWVTPPAAARTMVGKAALIILGATIAGRVLGMIRDSLVAYFFGAGDVTDAFFLAYKLPYLISLTAAAALTATFIPVFTQRLVTGRREEAWKLSVNIGNLVALLLVAVAGILALLAPWVVPLFGPGFKPAQMGNAVFLFRILMIGVVFDGTAGLAIGILNSFKRFALPAFSASVGAVVTICFVLLLYRPLGITSLAIGSVAGSFAAFAVLLPQLYSHGMRYTPRIQWRMEGNREIGMMVWPILIGSAVGKVSIFVDQVLGSLLGTGAISALNYSEKLFQLPLGLFVAGITIPIFPLLSEHVARNEPERLKATLNFALRLLAFVLVPAAIGLIVLRTPIIGLIFQRGKFTHADTIRTGWALLAFSLGLLSYAGRDTLTRVFYAYHDMRTPVKISVAAVAINIGVSYALMHFIGVAGLALGTTVALTVNFLVLMQLLRRKLGPMGFGRFGRSLARILTAAVIMGGCVWGLDTILDARLQEGSVGFGIRVIAGVVVGALVYLIAAKIVKLPELREGGDMLRGAVSRRKAGA